MLFIANILNYMEQIFSLDVYSRFDSALKRYNTSHCLILCWSLQIYLRSFPPSAASAFVIGSLSLSLWQKKYLLNLPFSQSWVLDTGNTNTSREVWPSISEIDNGTLTILHLTWLWWKGKAQVTAETSSWRQTTWCYHSKSPVLEKVQFE